MHKIDGHHRKCIQEVTFLGRSVYVRLGAELRNKTQKETEETSWRQEKAAKRKWCDELLRSSKNRELYREKKKGRLFKGAYLEKS